MSTISRWENNLKELGKLKRKPKEKGIKPVIAERDVKASCIQLLEQWGLHVIRNNTGLFSKIYKNISGGTSRNWIHSGLEGSGDLLACTKTGKWLEVEVKGTKGTQRPEQKLRQQHVERFGGIYILARSLDDIIARQREIIGEVRQW